MAARAEEGEEGGGEGKRGGAGHEGSAACALSGRGESVGRATVDEVAHAPCCGVEAALWPVAFKFTGIVVDSAGPIPSITVEQ